MRRFLASAKDDKPVTGIAGGTVAIWDAGVDGTDYAPAIDPAAHLDQVVFHTALDYLRVVQVVASSDAGMTAVSLAATPRNAVLDQETKLFDHGLGYIPLLSPDITVSGYTQPCDGTAIPMPGGTPANAGWRFIGFTADATSVYMHCFGWIAAAMTIGWKVRLYDEVFQTPTDATSALRFKAGEAAFGAIGKVDTDHRFVRKVSSTGSFRVLGKQTIKLDQQGVPGVGGSYCTANYHDGATGTAVIQWDYPLGVVPHGTCSITVAGMEADL